ncbi:cobalt ECF transporter T component CbiQ [Fodinibacter luteus]|uniref:Cobalt ECF transporter T component CbiQ n=1 Tax=Fodinibacter luteus TaxID=552064 RepID=A0ABP8KFP2_9MICO
MGTGHTARLHVDGSSALHRLPPHAKLVGLVLFVLAVVSVPAGAPLVLAGLLGVAALTLASTAVAWRHLLPRLAVALPVVVFALVLPFVATGPHEQLGPVTVSTSGLAAAWSVLAKGLTGVLAAVAFAVTTRPTDLVAALQRLRAPDLVVIVLSFMVRYLGVVTDELGRMRVARESRAFRGRGVRAWPVLAAGSGALFVRSYERGERVHLAMLSRGFTGRLPVVTALTATPAQWVLAVTPAVVAATASVAVRVL